jgi:transketolase
MGFPGFLPTGSAEWLLKHFGLTAAGIASSARLLVSGRR